MMEIKLHTVITLDDNKKYVVMSKIEKDGIFYDYLLQLSSNEEDVINKAVIVKEEKDGQDIFIETIKDANLLDILLPLFRKQLSEQ